MQIPKKRILVGLSGGVDSAVSAYLLKNEGHDVACGFMINYLDEEHPECCPTLIDLEEAKRVAAYLDLPLYTFDYREEYEKRIIAYIYSEYEAGRTPNPDVYCNNLVKFDLFLEEALALGYDAIATGHYARVISVRHPELAIVSTPVVGEDLENLQHRFFVPQNDENAASFEPGTLNFSLRKGLDPSKDQSYFLSRLSRFQLSKALFPIGGLLKSEVRELAKKIGLPNADRKDSQGLCFIGKVSMKEFLERRIPKKPGNILDTSGNILGQHEGAYSYTIGQRKGIEIGGGRALFVIAKDVEENTITVGTGDELRLFSNTCQLTDWIGEFPQEGKKYGAKIRYRQADQEVTVNDKLGIIDTTEKGEKSPRFTIYNLQFTTPQRAIAPGQVCIIYDGDRVLGSGVIV